MSKELVTVYKCDRCGKQMDSRYAILTLKRVGYFDIGDYVNKDLCADCYDKISFLFDHKDVKTYDPVNSWISKIPVTVSDIPIERGTKIPDVSPLERGTYVTWTGNDPLNKHLDVTCV